MALFAKKYVLTTNYAPLEPSRTWIMGTLAALSTNAGTAYIEGEDGGDVPLEPGESRPFRHVDLSEVKVKGTADDVLTVVGSG